MPKKYLRKIMMRARYGNISNSTLERMLAADRIPAPHYLGGGRIPFWLESEVEEYERRSVSQLRPARQAKRA